MGEPWARGLETYGEDVRGVSVVSTDGARHRRTNQVLRDIELDQVGHCRLEDRLDRFSGNYTFGDDALASPFDPVDCGRFLVRTVVPG